MGKASRLKARQRSAGILKRATDVLRDVVDTKEIRVRSDLPQEDKISHALIVLLNSEVPEDSPLAE